MSGTEAKNDLTDLREAVDRVSAKLAEREQAIQAGIDAEDAAALAAEEKAAQEEAARKATEREGDIKKGASQAEASIRAGLRSGPKAKVTYTDLQAAAARRLAGLPPLSLLESLEEA
ncbi:MAG TPA: hypothetical protein VNB06_00680, partial [Thermoanaerobaculia bacterium]|nr:hypothetical protein [Thermoanaerobaculia bacterium]